MEEELFKALEFLKEKNNTIPSEVIDFMKHASLNKLKEVKQHKKFEEATKGKKIEFHESFSLGLRLWMCLNCGFPMAFIGVSDFLTCECGNCKPQIFDKIDEFILKLQDIHFYKKQ